MSKLSGAGVVGAPIGTAYCRPVYQGILDNLGATASKVPDMTLVPLGYDWRLSVIEAADQLGRALQRKLSDLDARTAEIVFVAHSMGGVVLRTLLEASFFRYSWVKRTRGAIFLGSPHVGSPRAAAAALGLISVQGIRGSTIKKAVTDGSMLGFLGLMPPPDAPFVQRWSGGRFSGFSNSSSVCLSVGVDPKEILRHWTSLNAPAKQRPTGCQYYCVGNTQVGTLASLVQDGNSWRIIDRPKAGDDTVPGSSAFLASAANYFVPGNHLKLCDTPIVPDLVTMAFGLPALFQPFSSEEALPTLSVSPEDGDAGDVFEVNVWPMGAEGSEIVVRVAGGIVKRAAVPKVDHYSIGFVPKSKGEHVAEIVQDGEVRASERFFAH